MVTPLDVRNYRRLSLLKAAYDPENLFRVGHSPPLAAAPSRGGA